MVMRTTLLTLGLLSLACTGHAEAPQATTEVLVQGTTSWDGGDFSYPQGQAELTVVRIEMPAGMTLPWHCHPVPLAGSLTHGQLTVTKPNGESVTLNAGDGLIEVSNQWHRGHAEEDLVLIVVYAGAAGQPLTVTAPGENIPEGGCG